MSNIPELGVGVVYTANFNTTLVKYLDAIDTIEVEPQILWQLSEEEQTYQFHQNLLVPLRAYDKPKVFHGVGDPVGGSIRPTDKVINTLKKHIDLVQPVYFSEHLTFNKYREGEEEITTSFLLPQIQNEAGICTAVNAIDFYKKTLQLPFAFETGVNYFQPMAGEIPDGAFVRQVAERADCHILLDLHNIWANQQNGRQSVEEFISQIPLDRVIEIHLAGGHYYKDYYLDAHHGVASEELMELSKKIIRTLPNLKLITFEIMWDNIEQTPDKDLARQFELMHRYWDLRGKDHKISPVQPQQQPAVKASAEINAISAEEWEQVVGRRVLEKPVDSELLKADKGIEVIQYSVFTIRASGVVASVRLSCRIIRLNIGEEAFGTLLRAFLKAYPPKLFPCEAAFQFEEFLKGQNLDLKYLDKILEFEIAVLRTMIDHQQREVVFPYDPFVVMSTLREFKLPQDVEEGEEEYAILVEPPEQPVDLELLTVNTEYHV
ncbi:MAG: DUF692 family multinuclear iron-containing protein [Bacteroidota bacterium]